jgi:hypothetical protein
VEGVVAELAFTARETETTLPLAPRYTPAPPTCVVSVAKLTKACAMSCPPLNEKTP